MREGASRGRRSVLIVDDSSDSREVLRAVLEMRGWNIIEAIDAEEGLAKADACHPAVIVLDVETRAAADLDVEASFDEASRRNNTPLVVIGKARLSGERPAGRRAVAKPYHYAPLIRTIDELAARVLAKAS